MFFNEKRRKALETGIYICPKCNHVMEFENEWEDTLVCPHCGHDLDVEKYGFDSDEEYENLYPTKEDICGTED